MRTILGALPILAVMSFANLPALAEPIHDAAKIGDLAEIEIMISAGTSIDLIDELDKTALIWAAENGHGEVAQALVELGADVNLVDFMGQGPLYWAARNGDAGLVVVLIAAGADVNRQDNEGTRPLDMPINKGHAETAGLLKDAGAICGTNNDISRACNTGFDLLE